MNRLFLLAVVGFVLAIGLALPFDEDGGDTSNDFKSEDVERCGKKLSSKWLFKFILDKKPNAACRVV